MRGCFVFLCFVATALSLSVTTKPHGKHHGLHKTLQTAKDKDFITEETNKPQMLPTVVTFQAGSQEQEDEELSSEDNTNKEDWKSTEKRRKSTPVLLSDEELVDLLKGEEEEEEEAAERELEEEVDEKEEDGKDQVDFSEIVGMNEDKVTEAVEKLENDLETDEEGMEEEGNEGKNIKDELGEEVEKISNKERTEEPADKDEQIRLFDEMDGSADSEIPASLDYAADSGILQPLHLVSTSIKPHSDVLQSPPKTDTSEPEEKKSRDKQPANMASVPEQSRQHAADGEEVPDLDKNKEQPSKPAELKVKNKEPETTVGAPGQKSSVQLESRSRPSGKEEEKTKNESGSHTKGKGRKQKKNQRARKQSLQRDGTPQVDTQSQQDAPESDGSSTDNTVHKAKRRRAGKWGPLVGMNPVQIRATVELFPRSRPSFAGVTHLSESPADPCDNFRCKRGKTCKLDANDKPGCVCQQPSECPLSLNEFDHVCGTDNKTYDTSCELFATKCNLEGTKKGHRLHLDYTGSCKFIPSCVDTELVQFPLRMRDWLKNVLLQLYEHDVVTPGFLTPKQNFRVKKIFESERRLYAGDHSLELLAQDFEKNYNMYIYPVHWQFAQLDQHPSDRFLSHSELAPLRVPLVPMEHCTSRFFEECDADKDKQVSFKEWTSCFGIKNEDMDVNLLF